MQQTRFRQHALCKPPTRRSGGFTLIQILVVIMLISVLAALSVGVMGRGREEARRAQCDVRVKAIALALDAHRQEHGRYPIKLSALVEKKYLQGTDDMRCPNDVRADGSYAEYYIPRAPREPDQMGDVPVLVCPLHEEHNHGVQAYRGRFTKQFKTSPSVLDKLEEANNVTIERPGKGRIAASVGMALRGGDRLTVGGKATIKFADGTICELQPGSDLTVLQSYVEGAGSSTLYTIVRQTMGKVSYRVNHGSKFDVVTPSATAGVRGTEFEVNVQADGKETILLKTNSPMFLSTNSKSYKVMQNVPVEIDGGIIGGGVSLINDILNGLLDGLL